METQTKPTPTPISRFEVWIDNSWQGLGSTKDLAHRRLLIATTFALILMIGVVDYITGYEFSLQVFYLMPICLAVATAGWRFGVEASIASTAMWLASDLAAGAHFAGPIVSVWNALIALSTYLMVVWLLSSLIAVHGEMENRVRQRTAALTDEIAERERLEKAILEISERERRSIGHDLHDGLSQHLTGTALVAQALGSRMAARHAEESVEMKKIISLIEEGIEQTRNLAKGLLLAEIEREGLTFALREFASSASHHFHVDCVCCCDGEVELEANGTATHLYRIAQEAVRNGARHGQAKRIEIDLASRDGSLALSIRDDGIGLPAEGIRGKGLGLRIMTHRADIIGATLAVSAQPGGGTLVVCRLPHP